MTVLDLNALMAQVSQEAALEKKFVETTPKVLVRTPATWSKRKGEKRIVLRRLGDVRSYEIDGRKTVDGGAGGWSWSKVDVRLADDDLLREDEEITAAIRALEERRKQLYRSRFMELDPLTWDEVHGARKPYKEYQRIVSRYKKGEATIDDVRAAIAAIFPPVVTA